MYCLGLAYCLCTFSREQTKTSRYIGEGTIIDSKVPIWMGYMFGVGAEKILQPLEKQGGGRVKGALEFEE